MENEIVAGQRQEGKTAVKQNILAAKTLSDLVKTTLGPKGMDKILIDSNGRITVTNDGVTILSEARIEHPVARLICEISKTQEKEIGDGTTTVVILCGELLKNAEELMNQGIHPSSVIKGYNIALKKAQEVLSKNGVKTENEILKKIAQTAMTGKGAEGYREHLADIIVEASQAGKENIVFSGVIGLPVSKTRLIKGLVLDKEMPAEIKLKELKNAKVGLLDAELDMRQTEIDTNVQFSNYEDIDKFQRSEDDKLKEYAETITDSGVNIVFSTKSIHDKVIHKLSKKGIIAIRRVNKYDMDMLSKTTGAMICSDLEDFKEENFGKVGKVWQNRISDDECKLFVEECDNEGYTIMVNATSEHLLHETKRAITDGLGDVFAAKNDFIVPGGGAVEMEISKELKKFAQTLKGREQLSVLSFAEALESIPKALAINGGLDNIETMTNLRARHEKDSRIGLNLFEDKLDNTLDCGIVEPLKIKQLALDSATEVACQVLRCDDIVMAVDK